MGTLRHMIFVDPGEVLQALLRVVVPLLTWVQNTTCPPKTEGLNMWMVRKELTLIRAMLFVNHFNHLDLHITPDFFLPILFHQILDILLVFFPCPGFIFYPTSKINRYHWRQFAIYVTLHGQKVT